MIYKQKGSRYYYVKFHWNGQLIHRSTRATDRKTARSIEGKMRAELACGNWGILEKKAAPTLAEFLRKDFLPFAESRHADKPKSLDYYEFGSEMLRKSDLAGLRLDEITGQHAGQFAARHSSLSPSTVNCGLRTLRRAVRLAFEWGKLERLPKISLAKGERQRDRVLSEDEAMRYLAACAQPWHDIATIMLGTGACPWSELAKLRWEHVLLNEQGGIIQIAEGKTKARRRLLPMVPRVYQTLKARHEAQGCPSEGWVFPSESASGHLMQGSAKNQHAKAFTVLAKAHAENPEANPEVKPFPPYTLRHTALTWLAPYGDAFALMRAAGHSQIATTMRYIHPQSEEIEKMFDRLSRQMGRNEKALLSAEGQGVVRDGGHSEKCLPGGRSISCASAEESKVLVSREGIEPPTY
ncbi:MAG: site-specific integrase [Terriglobia bacterium]|jgi:integrase